jgi:hypothetical protein
VFLLSPWGWLLFIAVKSVGPFAAKRLLARGYYSSKGGKSSYSIIRVGPYPKTIDHPAQKAEVPWKHRNIGMLAAIPLSSSSISQLAKG